MNSSTPRTKKRSLPRCSWADPSDPLYLQYHDTEWGIPVFDDRIIFEFLVLESFQAGLSWRTILHKRENFRKAFAKFDPQKIARFTPAQRKKLLQNEGIIRNRLKIEAAINNAKRFLEVQKEFGSFSTYMWGWVGGKPIEHAGKRKGTLPAFTPLARAWSEDLKYRGFKFLGPTTLYSHMQAVGMVNDHLAPCFQAKN